MQNLIKQVVEFSKKLNHKENPKLSQVKSDYSTKEKNEWYIKWKNDLKIQNKDLFKKKLKKFS